MEILRLLPLMVLASCSANAVAPEPVENALGCVLTYPLPTPEFWAAITAIRKPHRTASASTNDADPFDIVGFAELHAAEIAAMRDQLMAAGVISVRGAPKSHEQVDSAGTDGSATGWACPAVVFDPERWREVSQRQAKLSVPRAVETAKGH